MAFAARITLIRKESGMKSLANDMLRVASGILTDYLMTYPTDKLDVSRDYKRLAQLVKERGIGVFVLDLPALDNLLLQALENSRLILDGTLSKRASKSILVPRLFRGLWLRIFDEGGNLRESIDSNSILILRQLCCLGKKLEIGCSTQRRETVVEEYYNVEREIASPTLSWSSDDLGSDSCIDSVDLFDLANNQDRSCGVEDLFSRTSPLLNRRTVTLLKRLQRNADLFSAALGSYDPYHFSDMVNKLSTGIGLRHGPGAVADQKRKEYKYDFPSWSAKLEQLFPYRYFGSVGVGKFEQEAKLPNQTSFSFSSEKYVDGQSEPCSSLGTASDNSDSWKGSSSFLDDVLSRRDGIPSVPPNSGFPDEWGTRSLSRNEFPSKLLAVPKTAKGPRLIASESVAHQWCQQLTKKFLEERLKSLFDTNFISFRRQDLSGDLVRQASLSRRLTTVDLSSASDRLSCYVVERIFRRNKSLLRALHATRTRWMVDTVSCQPNFLILKKFASQGTAVTFPVQTIVFFLIAITCSGFLAKKESDFFCNNRICNSIGRLRNKVRIYGDDIIMPVDGYADLRELLSVLGLKINEEKSFSKGYFRESCGTDCYRGDDVTPIKTTSLDPTKPQSRQSLVDYSNNLFKIGFWHAAKVVESITPRWVVNNLPVVGLDCGGIGRTSFCGSDVSHLRNRWNAKLQRWEVRRWSLIGTTTRKPTNSASALLQYFAEDPIPTLKWVHGVSEVPKSRDGLRWEFPSYAAFSESRFS